MKLSGTINGRRIVAFIERDPEGKKPNVKLYDLTDTPEGARVDWRACDIGALWVDNWDEVGPPPGPPTGPPPGTPMDPAIPDDDDVQF